MAQKPPIKMTAAQLEKETLPMDPSSLEALAKHQLFSTLSPAARAQVVTQSFIQSQPADAVLFEQGQTAQFLHVILTGRVALVGLAVATGCSVSLNGEDVSARQLINTSLVDREAIIEIFGAGDVVTIAAVLLNLPYLMSARIVEPTRIAYVPASLVRNCLGSELDFAKEAALMLARHWRLLSRQLKDQKLRSGTQRLGAYLLTLSDGRSEGLSEVVMPMDRRTLASWLGMSAENLSRALAQLKSVGVQVNGRHAQIDDIARIRSFCLEDDLR